MLSQIDGLRNRSRPRVLYTDVDGTLTWRGGLMLKESIEVFRALVDARAAGIDVVPVSGRGRIQVREFIRLLGLPRGIGELGCLHVAGSTAAWEYGEFPFDGHTPVEVMEREGLLDLVMSKGDLEAHDPWNEGRHATLLLRGHVDLATAEAALRDAGAGWCQLVDNGLTRNGMRVYHLMPRGAGKAYGVRRDLEMHAIDPSEAVYVGDSRADLECAQVVGSCWLVANADPELEWPNRTVRGHGDGVAELIDSLLA